MCCTYLLQNRYNQQRCTVRAFAKSNIRLFHLDLRSTHLITAPVDGRLTEADPTFMGPFPLTSRSRHSQCIRQSEQ